MGLGGALRSCPTVTPPRADGTLPESALAGVGERPFGVYVHVPFCAVRCGYCDFNTYTATELGDAPAGRRRRTPRHAVAEVRAGRGGCWATGPCPVSTVFFGGGTPTLLPPDDLAADPRGRSTPSSGWRPAPR